MNMPVRVSVSLCYSLLGFTFFSFFNKTLMTANCKQSTFVVLEYILYMASYVVVTITGIIRRP